MEFEWDNKKAVKNLKKYGVSFREAASFFGDPLAITFDDPDHSIDEDRFLTFGTTRTEKNGCCIPLSTKRFNANHKRPSYGKT